MRKTLAAIALSCAASAQQQPAATLKWAWTQGVGGAADSFHVRRSDVTGGPYLTVGTVVYGVTGFIDNSVAFGHTYYYVVVAHNPYGDSGNSVEITCVVPPKHQGKPKSCTGPVGLSAK